MSADLAAICGRISPYGFLAVPSGDPGMLRPWSHLSPANVTAGHDGAW